MALERVTLVVNNAGLQALMTALQIHQEHIIALGVELQNQVSAQVEADALSVARPKANGGAISISDVPCAQP